MNRRRQASDHASRKSGCSLRRLDRGRMGNWGRSKYDDSNKDNKIDRSDAVFKLLRLWVDINGDGSLSTSEASCVRLSADMKEDGYLDGGELLGVRAESKRPDDGFYTLGIAMTVSTSGVAPVAPTTNVLEQRPQTLTANGPGNAVFAGLDAPDSPVYASLPVAIGFTAVALLALPGYGGVPASNDCSLWDMDNVYLFGNGSYVAFSASQVKINNSNRTYMIGTAGADSFDSSTYANTRFFNNSLLVNFLGCGGNDEMGGSTRNDKLWGGTDNDTEYRYAGDDKFYGEERDGVLYGQGANQTFVSNDSTWRQAA